MNTVYKMARRQQLPSWLYLTDNGLLLQLSRRGKAWRKHEHDGPVGLGQKRLLRPSIYSSQASNFRR